MLSLVKKGGETAGKGTYWDISSGERIRLEKKTRLPGDENTTFARMHPAFLLVVGPLLGLLYAIFLPLVGLVMVLRVAAEVLFGGLARMVWKAASFGWRPAEAYLTGRREKKIEAEPKAVEGDNPEGAPKPPDER